MYVMFYDAANKLFLITTWWLLECIENC